MRPNKSSRFAVDHDVPNDTTWAETKLHDRRRGARVRRSIQDYFADNRWSVSLVSQTHFLPSLAEVGLACETSGVYSLGLQVFQNFP